MLMKNSNLYDGDEIQSKSSFKEVEHALIDLIAETSIWVRPDQVSLTAIYPDIRRGASKEKGQIINGIRIDDNTYANRALKQGISKSLNFKNYVTCHIWPGTTYDERYHTMLPNLVLIPRVLAGLSDFCSEVINVLKYRSWELYGWFPEEDSKPQKPLYYPDKWGSFIEDNITATSDEVISLDEYLEKEEEQEKIYRNRIAVEVDKVKRKVPKWLDNPNQICSRILIIYMKLSNNNALQVKRSKLQSEFEKGCDEPFFSNYNQMKYFGERNHAKVFSEDGNGNIQLWTPIASFVETEFRKREI